MKLQSELAQRLLEIPDVESRENSLVCQNLEIARIREDFIEIRLTHPMIQALGLVSDETIPGWVTMQYKEGSDFPAVIALVKRAAHTCNTGKKVAS